MGQKHGPNNIKDRKEEKFLYILFICLETFFLSTPLTTTLIILENGG